MKNFLAKLASYGVFAFASLSCIALQKINLEVEIGLGSDIEEEKISQIQVLDKSLNSLGFSGLSASLVWMDFIQYYGSNNRVSLGYELADFYLTSVTESEPRFTTPYGFTLSSLAFRSARPERALEILEYGIAQLSPLIDPQAYVLPFEAGTISFLYMGDGERGRDYYNLAADWFEQGQGEPAQHWRILASRLHNNPRSRRVQFDVWMQVYAANPDPNIREFVLTRLADLGEVRRLPDGSIEVIPPPEEDT
ncbi:MAG: hypothetical protein AAGA40_17595 [Cyanobacteria bacterium P01_E01_bin.45]